METLRMYPAQTHKGRFLKVAVSMLLWLRIPLPLPRRRPPEFDPSRIQLSGGDTQILDVSLDMIGVYAGNPSAIGRRYIYLLCDGSGKPIAVAKVGFDLNAIANIRNELAFLQANAKRLALPHVLGVYFTDGAHGMILKYYSGDNPRRSYDSDALGSILATWVIEGPSIPLSEIPAWRAMEAHQSAWGIAEGVRKSLVQPVIGHGDMVPWNVLIESDGTWRVLDWERGSSIWVPGWDWFHFVTQPLILVKRVPGRQVIEAVAALFRSEEFRRYARQTGIEKIGWDLFRGYLIHALEVLKPTEGREALRELIEMTKTPEIWNRISEAGHPSHPSISEVVAVMQTPPPAHGQAIMNQYLLEGSYRQIRLYHVRMAFSEEIEEVGGFRWKKVTHLLLVLFRIIATRLRTKSPVLYYPPASPNMVPFLRDCVLLICTRWMFPRTVFHFHANGIAGLYARLPGVLRFAFRAAYMRPDVAIAISEYGKADGVFLNASEIRLISNGIPDQADKGLLGNGRWDLEAVRLEFGVGEDALDTRSSMLDLAAPTILFVGMVCEEKGVGVLLEACRILRDRGVRFDCQVVGRASSAVDEQAFRDFISDHDLEEQVTLTGPLYHEAKWQAYAAADVFCFPTFYSAESFGLVAVEAMMSGLPVVSTNWSGLPDIVVEGETGYLVPPRDARSVADRLELLIKDPELRKRMGVAGRKRYEENYTVETFREKMEEVLAEKADTLKSNKAGKQSVIGNSPGPCSGITISIITPSYGQLDWLRICVASVADQNQQLKQGSWKIEAGSLGADTPASTRSPLAIEHIIQDGGSPGIEEFAKGMGEELMSRYGGGLVTDLQPFELLHLRTASGYTLRIFKEPDAGMYDALNKGITKMSGDLWAWLNSDEQYLLGTLAYVAEWFQRHPDTDILCGDALLTDEDGNPLSYRRIVVPSWHHARLVHLSSLSCASFYRRSILEKGGVFDTSWRSIGDAEWMARMIKVGVNVKACSRLLSTYAFTGENTSESPLAGEEAEHWSLSTDAPSPCQAFPMICLHRFRKFLAGAYRFRTLRYALHSFGGQGRVMREAVKVGWWWPNYARRQSPAGGDQISASNGGNASTGKAISNQESIFSVLGTDLLATDYKGLAKLLIKAAGSCKEALAVDFANTHIVTMRRHDRKFESLAESIDLTVPDGMPLVWVMNRKGAGLKDRVYGPTFTREFLASCPEGVTHYLVGGSEECGRRFRERMMELNPSLNFIGGYHGPCSAEGILKDDAAVRAEIQQKKPDFIWVGLGTPKQYGWIARIKPKLDHGVMLAVGFAFDVNAGMKPDAPAWMQRAGLTWLYRMGSEPRRLIGRYLKWNSLFIWYFLSEAMGRESGPETVL
jgi:exopolysaccharide biosynthesis WecB/TagA/CpsF family protein